MHDTHVLIVDDDERIRKVVARYLALAHIRSEPAASVEAAMERIARADIALVVVDLKLDNGESGADLLAAIRGMDPDIPVVFFTGNPALAEDHPDIPLILKDGSNTYALRDLVVTIKREIRNRCRDIQLKETRDLAGGTHELLTDIRNILKHPETGLAATHNLALVASKRGLSDMVSDSLRNPIVWGLILLCGGLFSIPARDYMEMRDAYHKTERKLP